MATGEGSSQDSGSTTEVSSGANVSAEAIEQTGEYTTVDPGYEVIEPVEDELAALTAENKRTKPSNSAAAEDDDANDTDGDDTDGVVEEDAETQTDVQADTAESDDISDELLDRAIALGWELDDIRGVSDAKAFEKEIVRAERLQQRLQARKAPEKEDPPESKEPDWDQMIQDGHDPDLIALQKTNWQRASEAQARVRQLEQAEQQRIAQAVSDRFDDALNGLGDEYSSLVGKGRRDELIKSSPELVKNRQKVFNTMTILKNGYVQSGEPVPPESELIQQALQASFYKQTQEIARKSIRAKIKNAGSQALSRPRSGSEKELPGPERALAKEEAFWRVHS